MTAPDFPLRLADDATFAAARDCFRRHAFEELPVARRLGGQGLFGFPRLANGRTTLAGPVEDASHALVRVFMDGEPVEGALLRRLVGDEGVDALVALDLLRLDDAGAFRAPVLLAPMDPGLWIASDLPPRQVTPAVATKDVVFSAHNDLTHEFVRVLPDPRGRRVMELCGGTGVAALLAARGGASEAWTTDIGARSTHYAAFNARLSGLPQVRSVVSDVWAAAAGETFDVVVAHPPYVPTFANTVEYRDGGADGEEITARIVQGLPAHLRPGGECLVNCVIGDRHHEPIEAKLRRWLGDAAGEFDIAVMVRRSFDNVEAYRSVTHGGRDWVDAERWLRHFDQLGTKSFHLCAMALRRTAGRAAGRAPVTVRREVSALVDAPAIDWALRWGAYVQGEPSAVARVGSARPTVAAGTEVDVKLRFDGESWRTVAAAVMTAYPVKSIARVPQVAPTLLELCDGTRDAAAIHGALREAGLLEDDVTVEQVTGVLDVLLAAGALAIDAMPVPVSTAARQAATTATSSSPAQSTRQ